MNLFNINKLTNYEIFVIICIIIFTIMYFIKINDEYFSKKKTIEFFSDIIQHDAYLCKTNNNIFDYIYFSSANKPRYDVFAFN